MAEKSKTREVLEKGAWITLAIGFLGIAVAGIGWLASKIPAISFAKTT